MWEHLFPFLKTTNPEEDVLLARFLQSLFSEALHGRDCSDFFNLRVFVEQDLHPLLALQAHARYHPASVEAELIEEILFHVCTG